MKSQLFLLLALSSPLIANLSFIKDSQARRFGSSSISYTLSPFGKFPYGRELFGKLSYDFKSGCSPFSLSSTNSTSDIPHMLLLKSSDCNIKLQALNTENARAKLLIISKSEEEKEEDMFERTILANHIKVQIPTLIISHDIGDKLRELIDETGELYLKFSMPLPKHDHVDLEIFAVKKDLKIWQFLVGFKNYALQFRSRLNVKVNIFSTEDKDVDANLQVAFSCLNNEQLFQVLPSFIDKCVNTNNTSKACLDEQVGSFDRTFTRQYSTCFGINKSSIEKVKKNLIQESPDKASFVKILSLIHI